ncbi:MAG: hypothetical protein H6834_05555 [Planctomycetes bacterium]|nr:hypothetical protein [Planctomycetota bacterium]MCB9890864.1 hypothetical protein [Planctomycetota bacterium]
MNTTPHESRKTQRLLAASVFFLALLVFLPSLGVGFVLDDQAQVLFNGAVKRCDLGEIFGRGYWANVDEGGLSFLEGGELYRPLTTLSVSISYQLYGDAPFGYHVENVLFHAVASVLVGVVTTTWGFGTLTAWSAALLFAIAPIHIEPVASVILRNELLAAIFGLAFLWAHARDRRVLACVALLLALLCKESAIALPFVALAADRVFRTHRDGNTFARHVPWMAAVVVFLVARIAAIGIVTLSSEGAYFGNAPWSVVWLTMARFAWQHYVSGALFGTPLVFDYYKDSFPHAATNDVLAWIALALWIVIGLGTLWALVRHRARWAFPCVAFLLLIGPTANVVTRIGVLGATRLMYFPYLGVALGIGMLYAFGLRRAIPVNGHRAIHATFGAIVLLYAVQTIRRLQPWRHDLTLYEDIVANAPRNALALGFLGTMEAKTALDPRVFPPPEGYAHEDAAFFHERAYEHLLTSLTVEPNYVKRFVVMLAVVTAWLEEHRPLDGRPPVNAWRPREARLLETLAQALRASGELRDLPPVPSSFGEHANGLPDDATAWLDTFARAASTLRMDAATANTLARSTDMQHPAFQRDATFQLAVRWQALFRIWALLPSVNERLRNREASTATADGREGLRHDVQVLVQAARLLETHLVQGLEQHPHPLIRRFVAKIGGATYLEAARFWNQRFTRELTTL